MSSKGNGRDDQPDSHDGADGKVVKLELHKDKDSPPRRTSWKKPAVASDVQGEEKNKEPLINLPPVTKYMLGLFIFIHLVVVFGLNAEMTHKVYVSLGFIPGRFTGTALFEPLMFITPVTHVLLHGSWLHLGMNCVMLLAFGSGIERWIGGRKMVIVFIISALFGVVVHFALNATSIHPVIGASGGLSGLFACALVMINRLNPGGTGKYGMWPFIILWIGISVIMGFIGAPDGSMIAWAAHVGGFLGGFVALKLLRI
ncbi:MAG: rhomboid family intramembrane serine protease [Alphaproteobacteria bacterium]|nr:rhomboid family intramembrane serine protease [Alphaproteobacteria bacterium]